MKGEIVFVKTKPIKGWVYVETIGHISGYVPSSYLEPILIEASSSETRSKDVPIPIRPRSSHLTRRTMYVLFMCVM